MKYGSMFAVAVLTCSALTSLSGCSSDDGAEAPATEDIGPAGGTIGGVAGASMVIPSGALSDKIKITLGAGRQNRLPALPNGRVSVGPFVEITPHGTQFAVPITLRLPYASASSDLNVLVVDDYSDQEWETVPGAVFAGGVATVALDHFSILTVTAPQGTNDCGPLIDVAGQWSLTWTCDESCQDGSSRMHEGTVLFSLIQDGNSVIRNDIIFNGDPIEKVWTGTLCGKTLSLEHLRPATPDGPFGLEQTTDITFSSGVDAFQSEGEYRSGIESDRECTATCRSGGLKLGGASGGEVCTTEVVDRLAQECGLDFAAVPLVCDFGEAGQESIMLLDACEIADPTMDPDCLMNRSCQFIQNRGCNLSLTRGFGTPTPQDRLDCARACFDASRACGSACFGPFDTCHGCLVDCVRTERSCFNDCLE